MIISDNFCYSQWEKNIEYNIYFHFDSDHRNTILKVKFMRAIKNKHSINWTDTKNSSIFFPFNSFLLHWTLYKKVIN